MHLNLGRNIYGTFYIFGCKWWQNMIGSHSHMVPLPQRVAVYVSFSIKDMCTCNNKGIIKNIF